MNYVLDTSPLSTLFRNFYRSRFPTLWERFDALIEQERIVSTREVAREIKDGPIDTLRDWAKDHENIFATPTAAEGSFVAQIYSVAHFQQNIEQQKLYKGGKNADAFVIAKAAIENASVVTMETFKPHAARIPNICEHFNVQCLTLEGFMENEGWQF